MHDPLTRAAILAGTDKFGTHDYTPNYHRLFADRLDAPLRILEIGVGGYGDDDRGGQSLAVWRDCFPNARVTGIDIQKKTMDLGPRVEIRQGSQVDADFLKTLVAERGPFDIIVDDGSHRNEHIVETFGLLFPDLAPGGIYVAEDVQTSFHPRFGGSLEMTAPNAVGHFGALFAAMGHADAPAGIAAMERFHNMIAVHKTGGAPRDLLAGALARAEGRVHLIGGADLPEGQAAASRGDWEAPVPEGTALVVAEAPETETKTLVESLFSRLAEGTVLALTGPGAQAIARDRFTLVDHVEIAVHYPQAPIDALAPQVLALAGDGRALLLEKGDNTYPSNFAFDAAHPRAAAALDLMGEVLADPEAENGGLLQYAALRLRHGPRAAAMPVLDRLTERDCEAREYFQLAGSLAQRERRLPQARALFARALDVFPGDPQFSTMLAGATNALGAPEEAEAILRETLARHPRARGAASMLINLLIRREAYAEAATRIAATITLFPQGQRPERHLLLAAVHRKMGDAAAMEDSIATAKAAGIDPDTFQARLDRLMLQDVAA